MITKEELVETLSLLETLREITEPEAHEPGVFGTPNLINPEPEEPEETVFGLAATSESGLPRKVILTQSEINVLESILRKYYEE